MNGLTTEQRVYALRWAADYLEKHGEDDTAIESLRHCADMTERYCMGDAVIGIDTANGKDKAGIVDGMTSTALQENKKP